MEMKIKNKDICWFTVKIESGVKIEEMFYS